MKPSWQPAPQADKSIKTHTVLVHLYSYLLKLYPSPFRADFADDMLDVFALTLRDAANRFVLLAIVCRELRDLLPNLWSAHHQAHNQLPASVRRVRQAHSFVRVIATLLSLFLLYTLRAILSPSYNLYVQAVPFVVALLVATLSLIVGVFWGRVGGILTIISGTGIGCCMALYLYVMAYSEIGMVATVLIGLVWALPFLIFGILFYELSRLPEQPLTPA